MKKLLGILGTLMLAALLGGCGNQKQATVTNQATDAKTSNTEHLNWSTSKSNQLVDYMMEFGQSMNQNYSQVTSASNAKWYGSSLKKIIKSNHNIQIDGKVKSTVWLPSVNNGNKKKVNIVNAYVDPTDHILYIFTMGKQSQTVLVSRQTTNNAGQLRFKTTENKALKDAYQAIIDGRKPKTLTSSEPTEPKIVNTKDNDSNSQSNSASSSKSAPDSTVDIPKSFQGTWYGLDKQRQDPELTLTISGSKMTLSPDGTSTEMHDASKKTADEKAATMGDQDKMDDYKLKNWGTFIPTDFHGKEAINVQGWYQSAGSGETYYLDSREDPMGKQVTALYEVAGGTGEIENIYYQSKEICLQMNK